MIASNKKRLISLTTFFCLLPCLIWTNDQSLCKRSPTVGSPVNYIHKGLEEIYQKLYDNSVNAIPRMILDYTELNKDLQHYAWFFPQQGRTSLLYFSMGNIRNQKPSMENLFYSEVNENADPNASYNQILGVLKATRLDVNTQQPTPFILDKNSNNITDYTVQCGDIKSNFRHFQKHFKNDFRHAVSFFS